METANLLKPKPTGPKLAQFNRLLLEGAYPTELSRSRNLALSGRCSEVVRVSLIFISIYFDVFIWVKIPWARAAILAMRYYAALVGMLAYMIFQTRKILGRSADEKVQMEMLLINGIFIVVTLYLTITAYSYTVYKMIPTSRGGALPVVMTLLNLNSNAAAMYPEIMANTPNRTRPLFLVDGGSDCVYVTPNFNPFEPFESIRVYVFKADDVLSFIYEPSNVRSNEWWEWRHPSPKLTVQGGGI